MRRCGSNMRVSNAPGGADPRCVSDDPDFGIGLRLVSNAGPNPTRTANRKSRSDSESELELRIELRSAFELPIRNFGRGCVVVALVVVVVVAVVAESHR